MYEALVTTIKEVYPDVHHDNLGFVFQPYVTIQVVISILYSKRIPAVGLKLTGTIQFTIRQIEERRTLEYAVNFINAERCME